MVLGDVWLYECMVVLIIYVNILLCVELGVL